jgi:tRNA G18 (ribose-2'-O)-methylase SpoU
LGRPVYRLEKSKGSTSLLGVDVGAVGPHVIIAGSEGSGILLKTVGTSVYIDHSDEVESLNVASALAIFLHSVRNS